MPVDASCSRTLEATELFGRLRALLSRLPPHAATDRRHLLEQFRLVDMARKVVGVGSVGTRALDPAAGGRRRRRPAVPAGEGGAALGAGGVRRPQRVREPGPAGGRGPAADAGQLSDIFLGWQRTKGVDGVDRDFYVRQLRDWKVSRRREQMVPEGMAVYGALCGWTLARAHARSGDRVAIASYLGETDAFDRAIANFAAAYADHNERDHATLQAAAEAGRIAVQSGL